MAGRLLADVGDAVGIQVSELTLKDLAVIHDAVAVAIGGPFDEGGTDLTPLLTPQFTQ